MLRLTAFVAIFLVALGLALYLGTGRESLTALIPTFFGIALGVCGLVARRESLRKHALHVASVLALLGFAGSVPGLIKGARALGGAALERPAAVGGQAVMAVVCALYLVMAVRSFIAARRVAGAQSA